MNVQRKVNTFQEAGQCPEVSSLVAGSVALGGGLAVCLVAYMAMLAEDSKWDSPAKLNVLSILLGLTLVVMAGISLASNPDGTAMLVGALLVIGGAVLLGYGSYNLWPNKTSL